MTDIFHPTADMDKEPAGSGEAWPAEIDPVAPGEAGEVQPSSDLEARWAESADREAWPRPAGPTRKARVLGVVAAVVILGLIAVVILGWLRIRHDDQLNAARTSALAAGNRDAALIATYSYNDFGAYAKKIEDMSTPQFAANFRTDSSSLGSVLSQYKAGSEGSVVGAGVGQVSTTKATVYVFLDEKVTNSKQSGATERARMVVTLVRRGGKWLISNAVVQ